MTAHVESLGMLSDVSNQVLEAALLVMRSQLAGVQGFGVVDCVGLSSGFQVLGVEL